MNVKMKSRMGNWSISCACLSTFLLSAFCSVACGLDLNSTTISSNVLWSSADSPVSVTGTIDIVSGGALRIDEGVQIIFETPESGITNTAGQLFILGSLSNRVTLQPREVDDGWGGIVFKAGALSASFTDDGEYQSGSVIQFADVVRAGFRKSYYQTIHGLDFRDGAIPYLFDVNIIDCGGHYYGRPVLVQKLIGFFIAKHLRIFNNETDNTSYLPNYGLEITGTNSNSGLAVLENVHVTRGSQSMYINSLSQVNITMSSFRERTQLNSVRSISMKENIFSRRLYLYYVGYSDNDVDLSGNTFSTSVNNEDALYARTIVNKNKISISQNTFIGGRFHFSDVSSSYSPAEFIFENNTISESPRGAMHIDASIHQDIELNFRSNMIYDCISSHEELLYLSSSSGRIRFENNTVRDNIHDNDELFFLQPNSANSAEHFTFSGNVIENNIANSLVTISRFPLKTFINNIFLNNTAPLSIKLYNMIHPGVLNDIDNELRLPNNYWGNFQEDIVDQRSSIEDVLSNLDHRYFVNFDPVLNESSIDR